MSPWGWPEGLAHNLQIPQQSQLFNEIQDFYVQDAFSSVRVLQPYFKSSKGIGRTSLHCSVLTRIAIKIFSYDLLNARKQRNHYWQATYEDNFSRVLIQEFPFFWFTSSGFCKQPVSFEVLAPASLFLQGSHMGRNYQKRTTLRSKSSTSKGLLYAPDHDNCKKGMMSDQPRLSRISSMALLCCWGHSCSKIWRPSWVTLRCMLYGRGTLRIPLQSICSEEGPHFCREQSARKLSQDKQQSTLITSLEIPWGFHTWAVLRSLARPRSCKKVSVWGFLRERKVWFVFSPTDVSTRNLWQKVEKGNSPVVRLLPGSQEHHASRNPCILCQKHGGACTTY